MAKARWMLYYFKSSLYVKIKVKPNKREKWLLPYE